MIEIDGLIDEELVKHTKLTISNSEDLSYYIDKKIGSETLDRYDTNALGDLIYVDTIQTINKGHSKEDEIFINETFNKLDQIIDLDFIEMSHNNGSMIDIYHISYSSHFRDNVIGQAITQKTRSSGWWDIFWKDSPLNGLINEKSNHNTIIHEIGHTLGLSHPFNDPTNQLWDSSDTIMSYNRSEEGWNTWFSKSDTNALIKIWGRENDKGYMNFDGKSSDYKYFRNNTNSFNIKTEIGLEEIGNVKDLIFSDKSINVKNDIKNVYDLITGIDDSSGKIYRLYNAAFGRFPDFDGIRYWIEKNKSGENEYWNIANSFLLSEEFKMMYGLSPSNKDYITNLYQNVLDRDPDIDGYNYWFNQIEQGLENKVELLIGFAESNENKSIFMNETNIL